MATVPLPLGIQTPDVSLDTTSPSSQSSKPQRVLACVLCQKRKVKCDRQYPCSNCIKSRAQCVQATLPPRRRRRKIPERELLQRLHKYEDLLRQNNIPFDPFHRDSPRENDSGRPDNANESDDGYSENGGPDLAPFSSFIKSKGDFEAKYALLKYLLKKTDPLRNVWHAMSQGFREPDNDSDSSCDDVRESAIKKAWSQTADNDYLLFGSRSMTVDRYTLQPDPIQIFKLWQIYVDNVNPLLRVTHTPSLQGRIIEAASDIKSIDPTLEALMFSIYCMAILSLTTEECQTMFSSSREDLLLRYQFGCQQALLNCVFLRSNERDSLTALFLYLVSVRPSTVPQSLSPMLGIAIRIAQRMAIHSEAALAKCTAVEAELRRRLWWSLVLFDTRVGEMVHSITGTLNPTWDCRIPLNVNDSDLRPDMKGPPEIQGKSSEALFAVVRAEIGDYIRQTDFYLSFTNPALKPIARHLQSGSNREGGELVHLETMIEERYLRFCDQENPIHFMTIWTARAHLAKYRLLELHSRYAASAVSRTEARRDGANSHALRMLECDAKIMTSPVTKGFRWLNHYHFPFPAYIQLIQDLRRRPTSERSGQMWEAMSDSYEAWFDPLSRHDSPLLQLLAELVLQPWAACEAASKQRGETLTPPRIVSSIRHNLTQVAEHARNSGAEQPNTMTGLADNEFQMSMPLPVPMSMGMANQGLPYAMGMPDAYTGMRQEIYSGMPVPPPSDAQMADLDWNAFGGWPGWGN